MHNLKMFHISDVTYQCSKVIVLLLCRGNTEPQGVTRLVVEWGALQATATD